MATNFSTTNISAIELGGKKYNIKSIPFHGTAEEWNAHSDYIPKEGEFIIFDLADGKRIKIGDGVTTVIDLPFADTVDDVITNEQIDTLFESEE